MAANSPSTQGSLLKVNCLTPLAFPSPPHSLPHAEHLFLYTKTTLRSPILLSAHSTVDVGWYLHTLVFLPSNSNTVSSVCSDVLTNYTACILRGTSAFNPSIIDSTPVSPSILPSWGLFVQHSPNLLTHSLHDPVNPVEGGTQPAGIACPRISPRSTPHSLCTSVWSLPWERSLYQPQTSPGREQQGNEEDK